MTRYPIPAGARQFVVSFDDLAPDSGGGTSHQPQRDCQMTISPPSQHCALARKVTARNPRLCLSIV